MRLLAFMHSIGTIGDQCYAGRAVHRACGVLYDQEHIDEVAVLVGDLRGDGERRFIARAACPIAAGRFRYATWGIGDSPPGELRRPIE